MSSPSLDLYSPPDPLGGQAGGQQSAAAPGASGDDIVLEGTISSVPGQPSGSSSDAAFNTLDEPIKETVLRDVRAVARKFYHVLYPVEKNSLLRVS